MRLRISWIAIGAAVFCTSVFAQQPAPARGQATPAPPASAQGAGAGGAAGAGAARGGRGGGAPQVTNPDGVRVFIRAGLKSHGEGQHDYPQFLADWSKVLTDRGARVMGSL